MTMNEIKRKTLLIVSHLSECTSTSVMPEANVTGVESFVINTPHALMTLASSLDYEVATRYMIVLEVVDSAALPPTTGRVVVKVSVISHHR